MTIATGLVAVDATWGACILVGIACLTPLALAAHWRATAELR